jgi:MFS family permease
MLQPLIRAFHGLACASFFPAASALAVNTAAPERWGEALGWFTTSTQSAMVAGPLIGGLLLSHYGFGVAFYSCSAMPLLGLIFAGLALGPTIMGIVANMSSYPIMFRTGSLSLILGLIVIFSLYRTWHR